MLDELVVGIVALNLLFSLWMMRVLALEIKKSVEELDRLLAGAIANLIEKGIGDIEPINPIQQAIASLIQNNLRQTQGEVIEVKQARDQSGKFA